MPAGIPILMYHEVGPIETLAERYTVPDAMFRQQLQYLRDHGFQTLSLEQFFRAASANGTGTCDKMVVITFDDNNICHFAATTPILIEFNFRATFFIVSAFLDTKPDMLNSAQLVQMSKAGMHIESHSHTHRFLSELDLNELREELATSRRVLEERVQTEVRFISCPGGRYNSSVLDAALDLGYLGVCTSAPGLNASAPGEPPRMLNRFLISTTTTLETFERIVNGDERYIRGEVLRHRAKGLVKALLGNERYDRLWRRYRRNV